jgi:alkaline phosphatase D
VRFRHGVASGDPLRDRVILWTRVTVDDDEPVTVRWAIATDEDLDDVVASGTADATAARDHTVHVDATGLDAATTYYYRFEVGGARSVVGRTRTLPAGELDNVRLAIVSCSNYAAGYFTVYGHIAERRDIDCVVHLGDYIYEYERGRFDVPAAGRPHDPAHEIVTLADYRTRYASYRRDPDLQALHQWHPMIALWDDHEFADNASDEGALNHNRGEGDWYVRKESARRAYLEWLPVRAPDSRRIYRSFAFGDLLDLVVLDTRHAGRARPPRAAAVGLGGDRPLLGTEQEEWLQDRLDESRDRGAPWRVLAQQVMVGQLRLGGVVVNVDQWDGYPEERARLLEAIGDHGDVVIVTGDIHTSWANDIAADPFDADAYDPTTGAGAVAVEFVAPSVTALALPELLDRVDDGLGGRLPHVRWVDLVHHGYVLLDVDRERVQGDWYHVDFVDNAGAAESFAKGFATKHGDPHLEEVQAASRARTTVGG